MKSLNLDINRYKLQEEGVKVRKVLRWQDYAAKICKEFKINKPFDAIIFRQAKLNMAFLEGRVAMAYEKCEMDRGKIDQYGRYLIALFRKTKPWENK